jgi:predicted hotdog family 3-hydroxylacyl-ACP dehydratase
MVIENEELASIIPHRGRMLLLSRVMEYNLRERNLRAECHVTEDCLFYDHASGGVPGWVGFEFIAQAISALCGLRIREMGEEPRIGFIMSVSSMRIGLASFKAGSRLEIKVRECGSLDMVYNFEGEIFLEGKKVMEGKLTVLDVSEEQVEIMKEGSSSIE